MASVAVYEHRCGEDEQQRRRRNRTKAFVIAAVAIFALATRRDEVPPPPPPQAAAAPAQPVERVVTQTKVVTLLQTFEPFGPPPPSRMIVAPGAIAFDAQRLGTGSHARLVTIANDGAYPLDARISLHGDDGFAITNGCASKLSPHSQCAVGVVFQPRRGGMHRATLSMNAQRVNLSGSGIEERIVIDKQPPPPPPPPPPAPTPKPRPAIVNPENIVFHSAGRERATITNPNDVPLRITAIEIVSGTPDGYKIPDRNRCLTTLAPRAQCAITIMALPRAVARRQTIRIQVSSE